MSHKIEQVEAELKRAMAKVLQTKIADPRIRGMISITRMKVSKDLRQAQVNISVLPEQYQKMTLSGLNHAKVHIQHLVRKEVAMRIVPHFEFKLDESLKKQAEVYKAINEGMAKTGYAKDADSEEPDVSGTEAGADVQEE